MMSQRESYQYGAKGSSLFLVFLLLLSSLGGLTALPGVSASETGDLAIIDGSSPTQDAWASSYDTFTFTAQIKNQGLGSAGLDRLMRWHVCLGDLDGPICKSNYDSRGQFILTNLAHGQYSNITSANTWNPPAGSEGIVTVVFSFDISDQVSSNDVLKYNFNVSQSFVDLSVDESWKPYDDIEGLAIFDGQKILNSNTNYTLKAKGTVNSCGSCNFNASIGWQLWDQGETVMLDESYSYNSGLNSWGVVMAFGHQMPVFNYPFTGTYILKWGLYNSTGTPYSDLNQFNDITSTSIIIDDTIDVAVASMYPAHDSSSEHYYFGNEMVYSEVSNLGNKTVENFFVVFQVFDLGSELKMEQQCLVTSLIPTQSHICKFNITVTGDNRILKIAAPNNFLSGQDAKTSDNIISEQTDIIAGDIKAEIQQQSSNGNYNTGDAVVMVAKTGITAAGPLNYSWWVSGIINLAYGQVLNISGSTLGLGDHMITLRVIDDFGTVDSVHEDITIFDHIDISNEPYYTGNAITRSEAYLETETILPKLGVDYGVGSGQEPLMLMSFDILSQADGSADVGMDSMEFTLNMSALLPSNIDLSTVDVRQIDSVNDNVWSYIESPNELTNNQDGTFTVSMISNGAILIVGVLPEANVSLGGVDTTLLKDGQVELNWSVSGDLSNPYLGGWQIYKIIGAESSSTYFPDPASGINLFVWEELTLQTKVATVATGTNNWVDPVHLQTGDCASYAIMPADRSGNPDYQKASITTNANGIPGMICGDAIPPAVTISNFVSNYDFTNSSDCYDISREWNMCYEVSLTWIWPEDELSGPISWNLYRVESRPVDIDLRFIAPISTDIQSTPGETGYFNQSGSEIDGIRPYRTYYYILAPIDWVGNENTLTSYPSSNVNRVHIEDLWWDYNQHIIPVPPTPEEPPLGVPWLGELQDSMQEEIFLYSGGTLITILFLSIILIPLIIKKRKRLKRVISARNRRNPVGSDDEFEDFFD
jgi:hypothetical protein